MLLPHRRRALWGPSHRTNLAWAVGEGYKLIVARARVRSGKLAASADGARDTEIARAKAYHADALASIARRRTSAAPDRAQLLDKHAGPLV